MRFRQMALAVALGKCWARWACGGIPTPIKTHLSTPTRLCALDSLLAWRLNPIPPPPAQAAQQGAPHAGAHTAPAGRPGAAHRHQGGVQGTQRGQGGHESNACCAPCIVHMQQEGGVVAFVAAGKGGNAWLAAPGPGSAAAGSSSRVLVRLGPHGAFPVRNHAACHACRVVARAATWRWARRSASMWCMEERQVGGWGGVGWVGGRHVLT